MLADLTADQFREWQEFAQLDPFDRQREDMRAASIVQALFNVHSAKRQFSLTDVMLYFGDSEMPERPKQTVEYQEMLIDAWCDTQNAIMAAKAPK